MVLNQKAPFCRSGPAPGALEGALCCGPLGSGGGEGEAWTDGRDRQLSASLLVLPGLAQEPQGTAPRIQPSSRAGNDTTLMQTQDMSCPGGPDRGTNGHVRARGLPRPWLENPGPQHRTLRCGVRFQLSPSRAGSARARGCLLGSMMSRVWGLVVTGQGSLRQKAWGWTGVAH